MATSGFLVDIAKVTMTEMEEWKRSMSEAFAPRLDPAAGLRFDAWVIEGRGGPMGPVFVFDASICTGCYCCQLACRDGRSPRLERVRNRGPDTGRFWLQLRNSMWRHGPQGEDALRRHALQPLRRGHLHRRPARWKSAIYSAKHGLRHRRPGDVPRAARLARCLRARVVYMNDS